MDKDRNRLEDDESGVGADTHRGTDPNQPGTHAPMPGNVNRERERDTEGTGDQVRDREGDRIASDR